MNYLLNGLPYFPGTTIFGTGLFADGTAAAPSISFAAATNMGFYRVGPNDLGVSVGGAYSFIFGGGGTLYGANGTARLTLPASGSVGLVAAGTNQSITLTPSGTGQVSHIGLSNFSDTLFFGNSSGSYGRITWGSALTFQAGAGLPFTLVSSNGTEVARGFANGRFGIGTGATDSGALLQIGTNTTDRTGGMVFGTDTFLYRAGAGGLAIHDNLNGTPTLAFYNFATQLFAVQHNGAAVTLRTLIAGNTMTFSTGASVLALTLDASQNAIFAGTVKPILATTAGAPAYVKGALYFDTTLNKLRVGGATAWETITSA